MLAGNIFFAMGLITQSLEMLEMSGGKLCIRLVWFNPMCRYSCTIKGPVIVKPRASSSRQCSKKEDVIHIRPLLSTHAVGVFFPNMNSMISGSSIITGAGKRLANWPTNPNEAPVWLFDWLEPMLAMV